MSFLNKVRCFLWDLRWSGKSRPGEHAIDVLTQNQAIVQIKGGPTMLITHDVDLRLSLDSVTLRQVLEAAGEPGDPSTADYE